MAASRAQLLDDLKKLFELKATLGKTFSKNDVVYFSGAPADEFHVILKGRVKVDRPGSASQVLGPGELFGEIEVFNQRPRKGQAVVLDDETVTLALNPDTTSILAETAPHFVVTIIEKCCAHVLRAEQGGTDSAEPAPAPAASISAPAATAAAEPVPAAAAEPVTPEPLGDGSTVGPVYDVDYKAALWKKEVVCPNCRNKFGAWNVRMNSIVTSKRDSDFRSVYSGVNPNLYAVWVCPKCQLAAYSDDFAALTSIDIPRIKPQLEELKAADSRTYDFGYYRDADLAVRSYQLAMATYKGKRGGEDKVAGLYHRMAWVERERGNEEAEREYLQQAKDAYEHAFATLDSDKQGTVWAYLVAELNLRLGNYADAVKWFSVTSQQPNFKSQAVIEEMTRDRWGEASDLAKSAKAAAG